MQFLRQGKIQCTFSLRTLKEFSSSKKATPAMFREARNKIIISQDLSVSFFVPASLLAVTINVKLGMNSIAGALEKFLSLSPNDFTVLSSH